MQDLKKKKFQLASLGEWTHINGLRPTARDNVKDDILRKLLYVREETVEKPTVKNMSRLDTLLSAVDLENIAAFGDDVPNLNAQDFPGGTVSFLFERSAEVLGEMDDGGAYTIVRWNHFLG
jgi:DNA repair and recombination protein RAD54B